MMVSLPWKYHHTIGLSRSKGRLKASLPGMVEILLVRGATWPSLCTSGPDGYHKCESRSSLPGRLTLSRLSLSSFVPKSAQKYPTLPHGRGCAGRCVRLGPFSQARHYKYAEFTFTAKIDCSNQQVQQDDDKGILLCRHKLVGGGYKSPESVDF